MRDVPVELPIHLQVLQAAAAARPRRKQAATAGAKGSAAAATRRTRELLQVANLKVRDPGARRRVDHLSLWMGLRG